jgi:predicted PurR-regulated permease PerM
MDAQRGPVARGRVVLPPALITASAAAWRILVLAAAGFAVVWALMRISVVVVPFVLALLVTALLAPARNFFLRRGIGRLAAAWITFLGAAAAGLAVITGITYRATMTADRLARQTTATVTDIRRLLQKLPFPGHVFQLGALEDKVLAWINSHRDLLVNSAFTGLGTAARVIVQILICAVLTFLLLYDGDRLWERFTTALGPAWWDRLQAAGSSGWNALSGYVHGTLVIATFHGIVIGTTLFLLGAPLAAALAVVVFIGSFIPIAGALIGGGLAVLVTLATKGWVPAVIVLGVLIAANQTEAHILQPLVMRRFVHLHPIVTVVAIAAFGELWGIIGALVAVPLCAVAKGAVPHLLGSGTGDRNEPPEHPIGEQADGRDAGEDGGTRGHGAGVPRNPGNS